MSELPIAALSFGLALLVSFSLTPLVIRAAWRFVALDRPDGRKSHPSPVPRLGGVSVLAGFAAGIGLTLWITGYSGSLFAASRYHWIGWIGAIVGLFLCGIYDDLRGLGPGVKLLAQIAAGIGIYAAGFRIDFVRLPWDGVVDLGPLTLPLTLLWIVGVTNAINLLDGLDGLATGVGLLITGTIAAIATYRGVFPVTVISLALAGSLLGFLPYNFSPARIFLGDSGSQMLGLTLAVVSIRGVQKSATAVAILAPLLILGLPILDTLLVVFRRTWRIQRGTGRGRGLLARIRLSRGVFEADREHIHHNLLDLGLSHRNAVVVLYCAAAAFCGAAFALVALRDGTLALILAAVLAVATAAVKLLAVRRLARRAAALVVAGPAPHVAADARAVGPDEEGTLPAPGRARGGGAC